jgi:hypothetical protein
MDLFNPEAFFDILNIHFLGFEASLGVRQEVKILICPICLHLMSHKTENTTAWVIIEKYKRNISVKLAQL